MYDTSVPSAACQKAKIKREYVDTKVISHNMLSHAAAQKAQYRAEDRQGLAAALDLLSAGLLALLIPTVPRRQRRINLSDFARINAARLRLEMNIPE